MKNSKDYSRYTVTTNSFVTKHIVTTLSQDELETTYKKVEQKTPVAIKEITDEKVVFETLVGKHLQSVSIENLVD